MFSAVNTCMCNQKVARKTNLCYTLCNLEVAHLWKECLMPSKDRIERVVVLPANREDVWDALTQPEHLANWFGPCEELDLQPGGTALFVGDDGEPRLAVVEVVEPPRRFAF